MGTLASEGAVTDMKPCKGCEGRTVEPNCHMTCEKYLTQKAIYDKKRKAEKELWVTAPSARTPSAMLKGMKK